MYVKKTGSALVKQDLVYKGTKLGIWLSHCRTKYKQNKLEKNLIIELNSLPGHLWDAVEFSASKKGFKN